MTQATASALVELAARCEAAEGPDRELDARIWCALRGYKYKAWHPAYGSDDTLVEYTRPPLRRREVSLGRPGNPHAIQYTASNDAAMSLVPQHWMLSLRGCNDSWHVALNATSFGPLRQSFAFARSAPLAITAAALRARAATLTQDHPHE